MLSRRNGLRNEDICDEPLSVQRTSLRSSDELLTSGIAAVPSGRLEELARLWGVLFEKTERIASG